MAITTVKTKQQILVTANFDFATNRGINLVDPINPQDAATKAYVDALKQSLTVRDSVRAATTANITLSGTQTIDGVVLVVGDRVLVKDQSTGSQNGIYVVSATGWSRAADTNTSAEMTPGLFFFVAEGTANGDNGYVLTTNAPITLDTTALTFTQFSGAGQVTAGAGLTKTGNTIDVVGTAGRIVVNTDSIDLATTAVSANTYGSTGFNVAQITVDAYGRLTAASNRDLFGSSVAQNAVFAGPSSGTGAPSFRALVAADIPSLDAAKITSGQLIVSQGGTGASTLTGVVIGNGTAAMTAVASSTALQVLRRNSTNDGYEFASVAFGGGSVTSVSVVSTNGFAGSVATASTTPAITISTTVTGLLKGNGTAISAASAGTDYQAPISLTTTGSSGAATFTSNTLNVPNYTLVGLTATPTNGQVLIGNGTIYQVRSIVGSSSIQVTYNGTSGNLELAAITGSTGVVVAPNFVVRELVNETPNGSITAFTVDNTPITGTEHVYVNGVLMNQGSGNDYTISTNTITFQTGAVPQTGDIVLVSYLK
jgi:hypothetical protein